MRDDIDEDSASADEFQPHTQPKKRSKGTTNGTSKTGKAAMAEEEGPACQSCRKKKAKCSRRQPCSYCVRFNIECVYDDRKIKPGLRTGAVENLSQRVVALEHMFLGQGVLWQQVWNCLNAIQSQHPAPSSSPHSWSEPAMNGNESLKDCTAQLKDALKSLGNGDFEVVGTNDSPLKRKRQSSDAGDRNGSLPPRLYADTDDLVLPPDDLMDSLVEIYFANIHPWIPILHVKQFRERMAIPAQRQKLTTIFHAILSLCVRFSNDPRLSNAEVRARYARMSRQTVIVQSMESFSVENLQALVICAFDTIGSGRGPSAWSIVGSMTRTVEQLQLSVEDEENPQSAGFLIKRMAFLPPSKTWIEREERRRVFWNVFLMDRFCSIATGWNFSLTSADVKRRLPCEGALWELGTPLKTPTPFFGIADKSSGALPSARVELENQESLGGFAYCIEASESLSLVTMFFLQHAVNVSNVHDVQMWLMRFKELDLRLVQWKIFLPKRWREACALNADGIMDPNLTLSHLTHNTAVGLLHQGIAYPTPEWRSSPIRLPSVSSAETCLTAATEVSIIAEKYLLDSTSLTNPQFAFCLFISGRMLLAHALHYSGPLPNEFDSVVKSLMEISRRWNGPHATPGSGHETENLASKFAARLVQARDQGPHNSLDIRQPAYEEKSEASSVGVGNGQGIQMHEDVHPNLTATFPNASIPQNQMNGDVGAQEDSPDSISLAFPPLPLAFQPHSENMSARESRIQSPAPIHMQPPSFNGYESTVYGGEMGYSGAANMHGFEDLNSFFEYSYLPTTQRISVFSGNQESIGKDGGGG